MADGKTYTSATAFRQALEDRLNQLAQTENQDITRLRRMVAFERLLARLFSEGAQPWLLKGGYALEVRLRFESRATRDVDLSVPHGQDFLTDGRLNEALLLDKLREIAAKDIQDWFEFRIGNATHDLDAAPYGGARFPVQSLVDRRTFTLFHLDVGLGDAVVSDPEWVTGHELLSFAGIPPARMAAIPLEQQFAEKIHAYSVPREGRINSRTRDLVDLVLLIQKGPPDVQKTADALRVTFARRKTHAVPVELNPPPKEWEGPFRQMAQDIGLSPQDIGPAFKILSAFWKKNPQLHKG